MIKLNWPIKILIISLGLIFMQIFPIIIWFDLESALSLEPLVQRGIIMLQICS
jgi:hypothetical protein